MELSCESMRYNEQRRPTSSKFVELHVLCVPDDQWNMKLNKMPAEAIENFISAGFIRVHPDITLKTLRSDLGNLLGAERSVDKFSFLKCVGRSLVMVKTKQEIDLKVKTFAPPYAPQPELYLLPLVAEQEENGGGSFCCSQSLTSETNSCSSDTTTTTTYYHHPPKSCSPPARGTKEAVKFPHIPQTPPPTPPGPEEEEEEEEKSYSSTEGEAENGEEPLLSTHKLNWAEAEPCPRVSQKRQLVSQTKGCESTQVKALQAKHDSTYKKKQWCRRNRAARDSGVPESLDSGFSLTHDRKSKDAETLDMIRNQPNDVVVAHPVVSSGPDQHTSPPPLSNLDSVTPKNTVPSFYQTNRDELIEEIKLVREERKQLEWTRQELLRKGKDLLAQNRHRRNQARDSWKKKYFETKKATVPLEETLRNLRQELETFYNKLLHQLQARDGRGRPRHQQRHHGGTSSSMKNEFIIQIMTESYEIDNLKRKVEDAKMKLVTEIKLRKQAATELRALKAELAQKKSQSSHCGPVVTSGLGAATRSKYKAPAATSGYPT